MLRSRELRHRLELQEKVGTGRNQEGHKETTWITKAIVFGSINRLSTSEQIIAQQPNSTATTKITTRVHREVTPQLDWRIRRIETGQCYYIAQMTDVAENGEQWDFICGELVNV